MNKGKIVIYESKDGSPNVNVTLIGDNLWLSLNQIAELFGRDKSVISRHLRNIFKEGELVRNEAVAFFATVQKEGGHLVERQIEYFNLDAIISVGYRVNSKMGTHFRKWASSILQDHLLRGYSVNKNNITSAKIKELQSVIEILSKTLSAEGLINDVGSQVVEIVKKYTKTWDLLLRYDEDRLQLPQNINDQMVKLDYHEVLKAIGALKQELISKGEASQLFGIERDKALKGILGNIVQTFASIPVYSSNIERVANLLYFVIKDHPFVDGNKRIASLVFLIYLKKIGYRGEIDNNTLVALVLFIAQSDPNQKEIMVKLVINMLAD